MSQKRSWLDTHVHVSDYDRDGKHRGDILDDLLEMIERSGEDLRLVLSADLHWVEEMRRAPEHLLEGNRLVYELVRRAPGKLYGACTINPHFLEASLEVMRVCFEEWGFVLFGEMLPYLMDYRMNWNPVVELTRAATGYGMPVQVHISTSNSGPQGPFPGGGTEQLEDFMDLAERVPEGRYILAHLIGTAKDDPPVVAGYLDQIERRFGRFPDNFWAEIRDFNSPGVAEALRRIPREKIVAGTDWVTRVGPPFLPYGVIFGVELSEGDAYQPGIGSMVGCLKGAGADDGVVDRIGFGNAAKLLDVIRSGESI